jgi:hypothetical protein
MVSILYFTKKSAWIQKNLKKRKKAARKVAAIYFFGGLNPLPLFNPSRFLPVKSAVKSFHREADE